MISVEKIGMLHYTAPPIVGGVEAVIEAHVSVFTDNGYPVKIIAGRGGIGLERPGVAFSLIPEIDSQHPEILQVNRSLEAGEVPGDFEPIVTRLYQALTAHLQDVDHLIVHNVLTKHFNLPLSAVLMRMLEDRVLRHCIAWCHDFTWTSPSSRNKVHPGYPWDILRTYHPEITYVVVSRRRGETLAELFGCPNEAIHVVYNGVDPRVLYGLSAEGYQLVDRLGLLDSDMNLLMPVRVTQAKNIELALQVLRALKDEGASARLVVSGPPDPHDPRSMSYYQSLRDQRASLGLTSQMHFVFESGDDPDQPYLIDAEVVSDLYRVSDIMLMPSHREGFGMPILEAGLAGISVFSTNVPAAAEIAQGNIHPIEADENPRAIAQRILDWAKNDPAHRLRRLTRQNYTWQAIFRRDILPLLKPAIEDDP